MKCDKYTLDIYLFIAGSFSYAYRTLLCKHFISIDIHIIRINANLGM